MKATVKGRYEGDKATAAATMAVSAAGDLRLRASATDAAFASGPSLNGLTLTLEKPGAFLVDIKPHNRDVRFQFMNSALVLDKKVSLTYTHSTSLAATPAAPPAAGAPAAPAKSAPSRTALDCAVAFDAANKVSVSHTLGGAGCRVKYAYAHGAGRLTTMEPCFDTASNAWEFAVTRKFDGGDALRGTYHASTKQLGLEWTRSSQIGGSFKIIVCGVQMVLLIGGYGGAEAGELDL
ncbi:outer envelope pore protein 24, chloroplastic isoform X2 [Brachypodium distachyon]|uniref:outer envelope pore protein 24, chloroplastic isoform X2 n=1 Tax=Brachypodium distachyon TaxID=15368 RepID=UPI000D0D091D|nr:outer envelope pore protein 24, chloroplastic isoform X2 [Brachypodium distachyon]|eukprot:XP_024313349.1 outer envelope pore protein 24, chloroplastic isoform X2 [Brachypodium distachyon]